MAARSRRDRSKKKSNRTNRPLRTESLESRVMCTVNGLLGNLETLLGNNASALHASAAQTNSAPTLAQNITSNLGQTITGKSTTVSALGSDDHGETALTYNWSVTSAPSGGSASFSVNGKNAAKSATVTFNKAGVYTISLRIVDAQGLAVTSSIQIAVSQKLTSIALVTDTGAAIPAGSTLVAKAASQVVQGLAYDQFGALITGASFTWSTTSSGAGAPTIVGNGGSARINFNKAGTFSFSARGGDGPAATFNVSIAAQPSSITIVPVGGTEVHGLTQQFSVSQIQDQFHNLLPVNTPLTWTAVTLPSGAGAPTFSSSNGVTTVTFKAAGVYTLKASLTDSQGHVITQSFTVNVVPTPTKLASALAGVTITGNAVLLTPGALLDQFGKAITGATGVAWSATTLPAGINAPAIYSSGGNTTATFSGAGTYVFQATTASGFTYTLTVTVKQTLTTISVTPGSASVAANAKQQFAAQGLDQFGRAMSSQPAFTWSVTTGAITTAGLYTAPATGGAATVTVRSGTVAGTSQISITVPAPPSGIQNTALASLVTSLDADGSLSRLDVIQILRSAGNDGSVDSGELTDLRYLVSHASQFNMASYVTVLASDVVNSNAANNLYLGQTLGNLAAGSSATQLNNLVGKWFLGADHPTLSGGGIIYQTAAGSLFNGNPTHMDEFQGQLGDCYLISSLGTIADRDPNAIRNMFVDNGDGTFTVRFFANGVADYVTVDRSVAAYSNGQFAYSDYGKSVSNSGNTLWIVLAEKAYAEWNATGKEGRDGKNAFASIEGGWMSTVDAQILGHSAADYSVNASTKASMVAALASGKAVTIGTNGNGGNGLYGSHAYAVIGYNASTDTFTLFNPWGFSQPGQLTWAQLQSTCTAFCVADVSGTSGFASAGLHATVADFWAAVGETGETTSGMTSPLASHNDSSPSDDQLTSGIHATYTPEIRILSALAQQMAIQLDANHSTAANGVDAVLANGDFVVNLSEAIA